MTKKKMATTLSVEDKYKLYESSVQCHEADIEFITKEFQRLRGREPHDFREDFGGTAAMACDWVKEGPTKKAWAIDLDPEPIAYGKKYHFTRLNKEEQTRMQYIQGNVLDKFDFKSDITVAFNFSYFCFKKRQQLLDYFKKAYAGLKDDGVFFIDLFGGTECFQPMVEKTKHEGHTYFWDCDSYNPLTGEVLYYIHFKKDGVKHKQVFTYDWRMWHPVELREILEEAGFKDTVIYWEGDDEDGTGDGNFHPSEDEENCESWVTYICALK